MTDTEIIIEVAKLDGFREEDKVKNGIRTIHYHQFENTPIHRWIPFCELPPYLTSRDAIIPVIEKQLIQYQRDIAASFWTHEFSRDANMLNVLRASPLQLCIALLKATGKWKD